MMFCGLLQASLDNIRAFINVKFASQDIQPVNNPFLADSSPVPVDLGPRQTQTDPSVRSPYGSGGEAQEPVQLLRLFMCACCGCAACIAAGALGRW